MSTIPNAMKQAQLLRLTAFVTLLTVVVVALALLTFVAFESHSVAVHHAIAPAIGKVIKPLAECGGGVGTPC